MRPLLNLGNRTDIIQADALGLIDEEDGGSGRTDQLLYLVLTQVPEQTGLRVQPVSFINDQDVERVGIKLVIAAGALEQVIDAGLAHRASELRGVNLTRRRVLGHVLNDLLTVRKFDQQVHGDDRLAGAGAALDDENLLRGVRRAIRQPQSRLVHQFLLVDEHELRVARQQATQMVGQCLRRLYAPTLDPVKQILRVAVTDVLADEALEHLQVLAQEDRGLVEMFPVEAAQHILRITVMQVSARLQQDLVCLDGLVVIFQHRRVAPRLVGRMRHLPNGAAHESGYDRVHLGAGNLDPLLQFDDHSGLTPVRDASLSGQDEVDPFGRLRNRELYRHASICRDRRVVQHVAHEVKGVLPGPHFAGADAATAFLTHGFKDPVSYLVALHVPDEISLGCCVDDHLTPTACRGSRYFAHHNSLSP